MLLIPHALSELTFSLTEFYVIASVWSLSQNQALQLVPPLHNISIDSEVFLGLCFSKTSLYFYNVYILDSMTDFQCYRCCSNVTFSSDIGDNTTILLRLYWHIFPEPHDIYWVWYWNEILISVQWRSLYMEWEISISNKATAQFCRENLPFMKVFNIKKHLFIRAKRPSGKVPFQLAYFQLLLMN